MEPPPVVHFTTPSPVHPTSLHDQPVRQHVAYQPAPSPLADSVATLVAGDSPTAESETLKMSKMGDGYVVSSTVSETTGGSLESSIADMAGSTSTVKRSTGGTSTISTGKKLLGKGKIDAKTQDEFIAFMLGKK